MRCTSADSLFSMYGGKPPAFKTIKSVFDNSEFQLIEDVLVIEFIDSGIGISEVCVQHKLLRLCSCTVLCDKFCALCSALSVICKLSQENQKTLFRDNVQFKPQVTREGGGSGLGLWSK